MDYKEIQSIWDAFQSVQEKKLSDKQKELDVDNDGDIEGDDLAALRNNKKKLKRGVTEKSDCPKCNGEGCKHCDGKGFHEEAPADPVKKAPVRKGDKSNSDSSDLKGVKEDVEQVDEISQGLKNRYIKKAAMSAASNANSDGTMRGIANKKQQQYHKNQVMKRLKGISRATTKEEVELRWSQSLAEMLSDISEKKDEHTKGATESEKYDSKFSKGAKDFVAMHQKSDKEMEDKEQKGHDDVSKAGRATKASAGRGAADQLKNGDKSVVKPVSGVVTKETK